MFPSELYLVAAWLPWDAAVSHLATIAPTAARQLGIGILIPNWHAVDRGVSLR